jgi:RNase P subunit RPR2
MVQVIKRGCKPSEKIVDATCKTCESVLRFTVGEAKVVADQRDGDYLSVTCPVCSSDVTAAANTAKAPQIPTLSSSSYGGSWRD